MNLEVSLNVLDLKRELRDYAESFGETSRQALTRLAVHVAKEAAVATEPKGESQRVKRAMQGAIINGVDRTTIVVASKTHFNRMKKQARPTLLWGPKAKRWKIHRNQLTESREEVWKHIERHRNARGKPRSLGVLQRKVIPKSVYTALTKPNSQGSRVRLMAVAKGGWVGAGLILQRWVKFEGRRPLGKNFLSWARRHTDKGDARRIQNGEARYEVHLENKAHFIGNVFGQAEADRAIDRGWAAVLRWYQITVAKLDRGRRAA